MITTDNSTDASLYLEDESTEELLNEANNLENITEHDTEYIGDAMQMFLMDIRPYKLLTAEQEKELFRKIEKGVEEAKETVCLHNQRLVISVAKKYATSAQSMDIMDLVMEGNVGLKIAIERFDYKRGYKFSTYAINWIRQTILRSLYNYDAQIRMPIHLHERNTQIKRTRTELTNRYGREATTEELVEELCSKYGLSEKQVLKHMDTFELNTTVSLSTAVGEPSHGEQSTLEDLIPDADSVKEFNHVELSFMKKEVDEVLSRFSERNREIFLRRMGFYGKVETLQSIADDIGMTRERVRQIEEKILKEFQKPSNRRKFLSYAS